MPDPEALARITIDRLLAEAGCAMLSRDHRIPIPILSNDGQVPVVSRMEYIEGLVDQIEPTVEVRLKRAESLRQAFSGNLAQPVGEYSQ